MEEIRNAYRLLLAKREGKYHLGSLSINGK
jgi:hypothetical protein